MPEVLRPSEGQIREQALSFPDVPETVSIDETATLHPNEWVLLRVTAFDLYQIPTHGIILGHSRDRGKISEILASQPPGGELPYLPHRTTPTRRSMILAGFTPSQIRERSRVR